jgi:hypothetical protein
VFLLWILLCSWRHQLDVTGLICPRQRPQTQKSYRSYKRARSGTSPTNQASGITFELAMIQAQQYCLCD